MSADYTGATITRGGTEPDAASGVAPVRNSMLIDGLLVAAEDGQTFASINPATGAVVGYAPNATIADAENAIAVGQARL